MKDRLFKSFPMPDFKSRPEGESKSLKEAYINLRRQGFPDRDIFVYPIGETNRFKGEIQAQYPYPDDMVTQGDRIILVVNFPAICNLMPDLFTDQKDDFFTEEFNDRIGARRLFGVFDSAFLKMLCRLEWIRDIYAGLYYSEDFVEYISSLLAYPDNVKKEFGFDIIGFVLPKLYRYLGTEAAIKVYLKSVLGLECEVTFTDYQKSDIPENYYSRIAGKSRLGENLYLGREFKVASPVLNITLKISDADSLEHIVPGGKHYKLLKGIIEFCLPHNTEKYSVTIDPVSDNILFVNGDSYLGYGTVLVGDNR
jgi:hypothetical protein